MSLSYETTLAIPIIGSKTAAGVATGVTLESTYQAESATVATKSFKIAGYSKANFSIDYTMGATETTNSIEVVIEHSPDNINWYQYVTDTTSGGTSTLARREWTYVGVNAASSKISLPLDVFDRYIRINLKETGVVTNKGKAYVEVTLLGE